MSYLKYFVGTQKRVWISHGTRAIGVWAIEMRLYLDTTHLELLCFSTYCIYPKYLDTLCTYYNCPKIWNSPFYYLLLCLKYCCMYGKQCRLWSDAEFCGIWSGSTLFAKVCLSQYLGLLRCSKKYQESRNAFCFQRDVLLISCDLIYMNISMHHIANVYRTYDATVTMFLCNIPEQHADIPVPGPKTKPRSGNTLDTVNIQCIFKKKFYEVILEFLINF